MKLLVNNRDPNLKDGAYLLNNILGISQNVINQTNRKLQLNICFFIFSLEHHEGSS